MTMRDRVLIAGAGPVGMVAAANLVRHGVPVTVLEANATLSDESRNARCKPLKPSGLEVFGSNPRLSSAVTAWRLSCLIEVKKSSYEPECEAEYPIKTTR